MDRAGIQSAITPEGPGAAPGKIPLDTSAAEAQKSQKDSLSKLDASMKSVADTLQTMGQGKTRGRTAGYDANNTRDPLMSSIGAGQITS
jgi:hypothetical protein